MMHSTHPLVGLARTVAGKPTLSSFQAAIIRFPEVIGTGRRLWACIGEDIRRSRPLSLDFGVPDESLKFLASALVAQAVRSYRALANRISPHQAGIWMARHHRVADPRLLEIRATVMTPMLEDPQVSHGSDVWCNIRLDLAAALRDQRRPERKRAAELLRSVMRARDADRYHRAIAANNYAELLRDYRGHSPRADLDRAVGVCRAWLERLQGEPEDYLPIRLYLMLTQATLLLRGTNLANDWWPKCRRELSPCETSQESCWEDRPALIQEATRLLSEIRTLAYYAGDLGCASLIEETWGDLWTFRAWVDRDVNFLRRGRDYYFACLGSALPDSGARSRLLGKIGATLAYEATELNPDRVARDRLLRRAARHLRQATACIGDDSEVPQNRHEAIAAWANRGEVELALSRHRRAAVCFGRALVLTRRRRGETGPSWTLRHGSVLDGFVVASVKSGSGNPADHLIRLERAWNRGAAEIRTSHDYFRQAGEVRFEEYLELRDLEHDRLRSSGQDRRRRELDRSFRSLPASGMASAWNRHDWDELCTLADAAEVGVLVLRVTEHGTLAFTRPPCGDRVRSHCFDSFTTCNLTAHLVGPIEQAGRGSGWLHLYRRYRESRLAGDPPSRWYPLLQEIESVLTDAFDPARGSLGRFGSELLSWLEEAFPSVGAPSPDGDQPASPRLALVLEGPGLAGVPLNAFSKWDPERPGSRIWFDDLFTTSRFPNLRSLLETLRGGAQGSARIAGGRMVALRNPLDDRPFLEVLVDLAGAGFGGHLRAQDLASLRLRLPSHDVALLATHGTFELHAPRLSGLFVRGDRPTEPPSLRVAHLVMMDLTKVQLMVFCGCETGQTEFWEADWSSPSLVDAAMLAGARSVFASLWQVGELPAVMLLSRVLDSVRSGLPPAEGLREGRCWLRRVTGLEAVAWLEEYEAEIVEKIGRRGFLRYHRMMADAGVSRPFANPFYWAAFFVSGAF